MTDQDKGIDLDAINARFDRDRRHWWTRWYVMQGHNLLDIGVLGFTVGFVVGIVLMIGGH